MKAKRLGCEDVVCPKCNAQPGEFCQRAGWEGPKYPGAHFRRVKRWHKVVLKQLTYGG